jgi:thymidylate synthase (FAD)
MSLNALQLAEVAVQKDVSNQTKRVTVPELEAILYEPIPVLDHGFVRVVDYMGNDAAVVQAARVSYGIGTKKLNEDAGLINYLLRHKHTTPFEMCEIKFHLKMPIFVARQWIRHRTANVNEYSARYSVMDKEFYIPKPEELAAQSTKNHQGRSEEALSAEETQRVIDILKSDSEQCYKHYEELMNTRADGSIIDPDKKGIARELARMNLPINIYTQWYWKIDLHNLMHFLLLRADAHAQYEIRVFAQAMIDIIKMWVPITYGAFMDHRVNSTAISGKGMQVVKRMIRGEKVMQEDSGMSKREWTELMAELADESKILMPSG